jgi:alkylated DNA repair protein (DNA oxidative demethylase)
LSKRNAEVATVQSDRAGEYHGRVALLFDNLPPGFRYRQDFVTGDEETALVRHIQGMEFADVRMRGVTARRRVRQFGWHYSFESWRLSEGEQLPAFLEPLRARAADLVACPAEELSETLVTEYSEGATIGWHRDAPMFGVIVGISLLSACVFKLRRGDRTGTPINIELAPRSAYVLDGEARRDWQHSIPAVKRMRYSITFRTLRDAMKGTKQSL